MHGYKTNNDNSRNDDSNIPVCFSDNLGSFNMKVGSLVRSIHEHQLRGIVMEIGPHHRYRADHGNRVVKVLWRDGDTTCEFVKMLEVLSEGG